jgi:hypothetical protein
MTLPRGKQRKAVSLTWEGIDPTYVRVLSMTIPLSA